MGPLQQQKGKGQWYRVNTPPSFYSLCNTQPRKLDTRNRSISKFRPWHCTTEQERVYISKFSKSAHTTLSHPKYLRKKPRLSHLIPSQADVQMRLWKKDHRVYVFSHLLCRCNRDPASKLLVLHLFDCWRNICIS